MPAYATGETVTVSGTAIGGTAATYLHATECFMVVQDQPIRWRADAIGRKTHVYSLSQ